MFELYFRPRVLKVLKKIKKYDQLRINLALDVLKSGRFNSLDLDKIEGTQRGYRLRIGRWRILFALFSKVKRIEIVDIFLKKSKEDYLKRMKLL